MDKQEQSQSSFSSVLSDQLSNDYFASTTALVSSASSTNQFQNMDEHRAYELQNKSSDESSAKVLLTSTGSELGCTPRVPLSSSDTIILSTALLSTSDTLPISSLSFTTNDSVLDKNLTKDRSLVSSLSKPFSLITNISDRSVSLESIPSLSLFQPDHESVSDVSLYKSDSATIMSDCIKTISEPEPTFSETTSSPATSEITVVGSNRIPQSFIHLVKQHLIHLKPPCNKQIFLITSPEQNECNSSEMHNTSGHNVNDDSHNSNPSTKRQKDTEDEGNSDTDTEMRSEAPLNNKDNGLSRSDTVILNVSTDHSVACSDSQLHSSDTIILACDEKETLSSERSSEGFSFTSATGSLPPSLEVQLNEPSINKAVSLEIISNSLINHSSVPLAISSFQNANFNKSFYIMTNNGHLAAVRYISSDPLNSSQLSQLGLLNNTDAIHSVLSQSSSFSDASSRNVETKETQTDLVFGTNTLYFKVVDNVTDVSIYSASHISNTDFTNAVPVQPSSISSTVVISDSAIPPDHSQSSLEKFQRTVISLAEPVANDKAVFSSLQPLPQGTEYCLTPLQTSEPGLPNISDGDDSALFKCMECQEKFKTKHGLVSHEKVHRRAFKCDLCNATFTRVGNFTRHRKIHNLQSENQNAFRCNDCGREFLQRCDLKRHLLIHTKQEPYRCEQCGKGYIRRSDLVVHMRFHNKDKAFKCSMCDKKFFQTGDLSRHVRRAHMPNSQLTCGHCNRKYACESTLIRHMKAVHKDIILRTVNEKLQESDSSGKGPSVNTKDVLFTMTKSPERKH